MSDKVACEIRDRLLREIRDGEDYDHAYAAAEGWGNHIASLQERVAELEESANIKRLAEMAADNVKLKGRVKRLEEAVKDADKIIARAYAPMGIGGQFEWCEAAKRWATAALESK